jgi:hypothetical protein
LSTTPTQRLIRLDTAKPFAFTREGSPTFAGVVEQANHDLRDPFNPPCTGRFYEPLERALLRSDELPPYLILDRAGAANFG